MKKILITYASYGSGHKMIANYIKEYIEDDKLYEIKTINILDYAGKFVSSTANSFDKIYNHRMEKLSSAIYRLSDNSFMRKIYKIYSNYFICNKEILQAFSEFDPDVVLSTHFYGSNIAAYLKKQHVLNPKIITIVTDYKAHDIWMSSDDKEEIFIVANELVKKDMIKNNCYSHTILPYGIPYNEKLSLNLSSINSIYKKYKLETNKKTIIFFGGGSNGSNVYYKYLKTLLSVKLDYQIVFICGNNKKLKLDCESLVKKGNYTDVKILGFINNVYELLKISDIVITKPGGATVTECLEMQRFMVLIPGIGGQESYNAKYVSKSNYGVYKKNRITFRRYLLNNVKKTDDYKKNYNFNKENNNSLKKIKKLLSKICK